MTRQSKEMSMTTRTLIGVAVASTFGWTVAAHASNHHANWVAAGDEQYPPMVMFEGRSADTFAMTPTPGQESVGSVSNDAATVGVSEPTRTVRSRMRRLTASLTRVDKEWVATGEEHYPPMVMFEGLGTSTLASISTDTLSNTSPDTLTNTPSDTLASTLRATLDNASRETSEHVGSTTGAPVDSVGASLPIEPPAAPDRSTGTDMQSGREDKSAATNSEALDRAPDAVYTEAYVVSWTPHTSADWAAYAISIEPQSETPGSPNSGDSVIMTQDAIQQPSDSSSAREVTAVPERKTEDSPG
jgi:hypothetical protein